MLLDHYLLLEVHDTHKIGSKDTKISFEQCQKFLAKITIFPTMVTSLKIHEMISQFCKPTEQLVLDQKKSKKKQTSYTLVPDQIASIMLGIALTYDT